MTEQVIDLGRYIRKPENEAWKQMDVREAALAFFLQNGPLTMSAEFLKQAHKTQETWRLVAAPTPDGGVILALHMDQPAPAPLTPEEQALANDIGRAQLPEELRPA